MNKLWKIINDNGDYEFIDLEQNTKDEWFGNPGGWARYHGWDNAEPLSYRCASMTYYENFFQEDCKDEPGSDYERGDVVIEEGDIVVDVGANIGCFSRYALTKNPSRVICFEPFSKNFECLKYNTENTVCELHKKAISDNHNPIKLLGSNEFSGGSNIKGNSDGGIYNIEEMVDCMTLDSLFDNNIVDKIDFLKIDVEGAETDVINGISVDNLKKVNKISMEIHYRHVTTESETKMLKKLEEAGFNESYKFTVPNLAIQTWWRV